MGGRARRRPGRDRGDAVRLRPRPHPPGGGGARAAAGRGAPARGPRRARGGGRRSRVLQPARPAAGRVGRDPRRDPAPRGDRLRSSGAGLGGARNGDGVTRSKLIPFEDAARLIPDGAVVAASSSSGLACPDRMLAAIGERFAREGRPRDLTFFLPIAAGDMYGIKGIDHVARKGLLRTVIAGSYPSGPSSMASPAIWKMIVANEVAAYNVPSGILFDMCREAAAKRAGVMTRVGLDTFVDPRRNGCKMNEAARADIVKLVGFGGGEWLHFPNVYPQVAIIRGTTADEAGNISMEHEGAYLG